MTGMTFSKSDAALAEALVSLRREHDDLRVVSGADVDSSGFTLLSVVRNEIYFLPAFLAHYRALGVERFVFLNDRSDDGSFEYMRQQPDTVVVESDRTFGDRVNIPPALSNRVENLRIVILWRSLLRDRFAPDRWALLADLDEFVRLPPGTTFPELAARLDTGPARAVWGVMLDVYPADIAELAEQEAAPRIDMAATWYFDGEQHLRISPFGKLPKIVHAGARARLYQTYGVDNLYPSLGVRARKIRGGIRKLWRPGKWLRYNELKELVLLKWQENSHYIGSHNANIPASTSHLPPIQHFRFSGALYRKIRMGLREQSYYRCSTDHRLLSELLSVMKARRGSFLYSKSQPLESFGDFVRTRNACGV